MNPRKFRWPLVVSLAVTALFLNSIFLFILYRAGGIYLVLCVGTPALLGGGWGFKTLCKKIWEDTK